MSDTPSDDLTDLAIAARIQQGRRCDLCREDRRPGGALCWAHHDDLGRILDPDYLGDRDLDRAPSIPRLFADLDPMPGTTGSQDRRAPGFESQAPCNLTAVVMRDPRSASYPVVAVWYDPHPSGWGDDLARPHTEQDNPPRAVAKAVAGLLEAVAEDLNDPPPPSGVGAQCWWLHQHLDHLTARDDAAELHRDLTELHLQLRHATGHPPAKPVALCTGWVRDRDTGEKVECRAPLFMPPEQPGVDCGLAQPPKLDPTRPVMRCRRCDRPYTALQLLRLEIGEQASAS